MIDRCQTGSDMRERAVKVPLHLHRNPRPHRINSQMLSLWERSQTPTQGTHNAPRNKQEHIPSTGEFHPSLKDTGRKTKIENSVSTLLKDEDGHAFNIKTLPNLASLTSKFKAHRCLKKSKKKQREYIADSSVRALYPATIPPESATLIPVTIQSLAIVMKSLLKRYFILTKALKIFME